MDTITKVNQVSFHPSLGQKQAFTIKLSSSKFDNFAGSDLLAKIESWVSASLLMSKQDLPVLIIDMENVDFIDSQGLNKLLASLRIMKSQGSNLLLCSLHTSVHLVFEITRIDQLFAILPSLENFVTVHQDVAVLSY
ncbi:MAG: hypothetical protein AUK48_14325 [Oscillatoriales cyanobacterium CG2_30_44_21]|nr:MAG: hypothetical protein AUK48_14325 [Oscillatoriales cyanobacterium CG2_30_44_21]